MKAYICDGMPITDNFRTRTLLNMCDKESSHCINSNSEPLKSCLQWGCFLLKGSKFPLKGKHVIKMIILKLFWAISNESHPKHILQNFTRHQILSLCDLSYSGMNHVNFNWKHKLSWNKSVRVALQIQEYCIFCVSFPFALLHFQHIPPVVFSVFVAINLHFSEFEDTNLTAEINLWYSSGLLTCSRFPHGKMISSL